MYKHLSLILGVLAPLATFAQPSDTVKGDVTLQFKSAFAVRMNGYAYPKYDQACLEAYKNRLGSSIYTQYSINPKTLIESARAALDGVTTRLYPMGVSTSFSFMSDGVSGIKNVKRIIFSIDTAIDNKSAVAKLLLDGDNVNYNCAMSTENHY